MYVDDFKMAGPPSAVSSAWKLIREELLIGDPGPVTVFLGCTQREHVVSDSEGREYRALENNMEDFLKSCFSMFEEMTGDYVHHTSPTPYLSCPLASDNMLPADHSPAAVDAGRYAQVAPRVLMKILYAARLARPDLLRPVISMASHLQKWTVEHDKCLLRLLSYIRGSLGLRLWSWHSVVSGAPHVHVFADAEFAGCPQTQRSTSGVAVQLGSASSLLPVVFYSTRQHCVSHSTAEAEIVALDCALRMHAMPVLTLWQTIFPDAKCIVHEDNQAALQIVRTGKNPTLRHIGRTHRVSIAWLAEALSHDDMHVLYETSDRMAADIFTKPFTDPRKWAHACQLIGLCMKPDLPNAIALRVQTFSDLPNVPLPAFVVSPTSCSLSPVDPPVDVVHGPSERAFRVRFEEPETSLRMQVRQLPADRYHAILALLDTVDWPRNRRQVINGKGICLGATYHLDGPKVAGATRQARMEELCREINVSLSALYPKSDGIVWRINQRKRNFPRNV